MSYHKIFGIACPLYSALNYLQWSQNYVAICSSNYIIRVVLINSLKFHFKTCKGLLKIQLFSHKNIKHFFVMYGNMSSYKKSFSPTEFIDWACKTIKCNLCSSQTPIGFRKQNDCMFALKQFQFSQLQIDRNIILNCVVIRPLLQRLAVEASSADQLW